MKANKKTLMAVKKFLNEPEGYDMDEIIDEVVHATKLLRHKDMGEHTLATDECGIKWGDDDICLLCDFVEAYTNEFVKMICNVLDSFVGEDIDCYFEYDD